VLSFTGPQDRLNSAPCEEDQRNGTGHIMESTKTYMQKVLVLINKGKWPVEVCTAVARELGGFMWAIACEVMVCVTA
jgi:hypothetical protein